MSSDSGGSSSYEVEVTSMIYMFICIIVSVSDKVMTIFVVGSGSHSES